MDATRSQAPNSIGSLCYPCSKSMQSFSSSLVPSRTLLSVVVSCRYAKNSCTPERSFLGWGSFLEWGASRIPTRSRDSLDIPLAFVRTERSSSVDMKLFHHGLFARGVYLDLRMSRSFSVRVSAGLRVTYQVCFSLLAMTGSGCPLRGMDHLDLRLPFRWS